MMDASLSVKNLHSSSQYFAVLHLCTRSKTVKPVMKFPPVGAGFRFIQKVVSHPTPVMLWLHLLGRCLERQYCSMQGSIWGNKVDVFSLLEAYSML